MRVSLFARHTRRITQSRICCKFTRQTSARIGGNRFSPDPIEAAAARDARPRMRSSALHALVNALVLARSQISGSFFGAGCAAFQQHAHNRFASEISTRKRRASHGSIPGPSPGQCPGSRPHPSRYPVAGGGNRGRVRRNLISAHASIVPAHVSIVPCSCELCSLPM
jgi:hypothetical protein